MGSSGAATTQAQGTRSRSRAAGTDQAAAASSPGTARDSRIAAVEYAVRQLVRDKSPLHALPAVLKRLTSSFQGDAALAFRLVPGQAPVALAAYPADAATYGLLRELQVLSMLHRRTAASGGSFAARIGAARAGQRGSVLVAYGLPVTGTDPYALALISSRTSRWDGSARSALRVLASVLTTQAGQSAQGIRRIAAAEEQADEGGARFRLLSRLAPVGIVQLDAAGRCVFVNDRFCEWASIRPQDAMGEGWWRAIHPDDIRRVEAEALRAQQKGRELRAEFRLQGRASTRWVEAVVVPLLDSHDQTCGYLAAITDISDRRCQDATRQADFLRGIERSAEQLLRLVSDLALVSDLETGAVSLEIGEVSVPDLVSDAVAAASVPAGQRGVTLAGAWQDGQPVPGDRLRLRQVLDKLVSNAVKFTRAGGHVAVRATHNEEFWLIEVQDDGIGIPPDELGNLFGRFFRASNAVTAGIPGSGIGLSIVRMITELHGGKVDVRSAAGAGTTVSVFLPAGS